MDNSMPIRTLAPRAVLHALRSHWALPPASHTGTVVALRHKG